MWFIRLRKKLVKFILFTIKNVNKKKCLFLGTPAHKNLGDHAIVYAQYKYIRDNFAGCQIFEMSKLEYETYRRIVCIMTSRKSLNIFAWVVYKSMKPDSHKLSKILIQ